MTPAVEFPLTSLEGYVPASYFLPLMGSGPDFGVPSLYVHVSSGFDPSLEPSFDPLFDPAIFEFLCSHSMFSSSLLHAYANLTLFLVLHILLFILI
jgi:hypothetical protein